MGSPIIENRKAPHNFNVLDEFEVGVVLKGTEIKSVREGKLILSEAFALVRDHELYLHNAYTPGLRNFVGPGLGRQGIQ